MVKKTSHKAKPSILPLIIFALVVIIVILVIALEARNLPSNQKYVCPNGNIVVSNPDLCNCPEAWICTDWSACANKTQTRRCFDLNQCGTTFNKSIESQNC